LEEPDNIARLADYCLEHYYPSDARAAAPAVAVLRNVVREGARLASEYIASGFVHGVLNSDNIAITCESFDYGPWRFTPFWDGHFTAAYFDHAGLYSFGRQPEAIHWDILQLGIVPSGEARDAELLTAMETAMVKQTVKIDRFFFDWRGGRRRGPSPADEAYRDEAFTDLARRIAEFQALPGALDHDYWSDAEPQSMHIEEVEAIWKAIDEGDDWALLDAKVAAVRRMGEAHRAAAAPAAVPPPA
jgi:hypothetical protein